MRQDSHPMVIAISGASGAIYGIRLLEVLKSLSIETHLIISKAASLTITSETDYSLSDVKALASYVYSHSDIAAKISSGSFITNGMIVAPCSTKTLSAIASGFEDNLIIRAAGVMIKERRKLTLMIRETPLHSINLENMLRLSNAGVNIAPPVPAFYTNPKSIDDLVNHSVARVLDLHDIHLKSLKRWEGIKG